MEQSLIHLLRKEQEKLLDKFSCSSCEKKLDAGLWYLKGEAEETSDILCESCARYYTDDRSLSVYTELAQIYEFFSVKCPRHPESKANFYFTSTFQPVCRHCQYPLKAELREIKYKEIESEFFVLYQKYEKLLCSDRKKTLVTYNTSQLLQACSWLKQIEFGPLCTTHPWNFSTCLTPSLEFFCAQCENSVSYKFGLSDSTKTSDILLEATKKKSKESDSHCLNSYMIKSLWISYRISRKDLDLNLMALEALDLVHEKKYEKIRCVKCLKGISLGVRTGVKLKCGHVFCFTCAFIQENTNCPIDNVQINYSTYLSIEVKVPQCHAIHGIGDQKTLKLPCFHYSCEEDLRFGHCLVCGFESGLWGKPCKESKLAKSLNEFMAIRCFEHNAKVSCFQLSTLGFYCENCLNADKIVSFGNNLEFVCELFNSLLPGFYEKHANRDLEINNLNFLKLACYLKILSNQNKHLFLGIIQAYLGNCRLYSTHKILFFTELIPGLNCSFKSLVLSKVQEIVLRVTPNEDFVLCSVFIADQYLMLPCYSFPAVINCVTIRTYKKKDGKLDREPVKFLAYCEPGSGNQYKEFVLSNSVYLSDSCLYEIAVEVNPGEYFHGKLMSRTRNKEFQIQSVYEKGSEIGRYGGPFIGIGIFSLSSL